MAAASYRDRVRRGKASRAMTSEQQDTGEYDVILHISSKVKRRLYQPTYIDTVRARTEGRPSAPASDWSLCAL